SIHPPPPPDSTLFPYTTLFRSGIQHIIEDYDPIADNGYGFLCYAYSTEAFWDAMKRARGLFKDRKLWTKLMKRAMTRDFSWDASDRKSTRLNSSHVAISYAVFC